MSDEPKANSSATEGKTAEPEHPAESRKALPPSAGQAAVKRGGGLVTILLVVLVLVVGGAVAIFQLRPDLVASLLPAEERAGPAGGQPTAAATPGQPLVGRPAAGTAATGTTPAIAGSVESDTALARLEENLVLARHEQDKLRQALITLEERVLSEQTSLTERMARVEGRAGTDQRAARERIDQMETKVANVSSDIGRLRTLLGARVDALSETAASQGSRFDAFNDRLIAIETAIRANPLPKREDVEKLRAAVAAANERLARIDTTLATRGQRIARLEELIAQGGAASAAEAALVLAIGQLREAIASGEPFVDAQANVGAMLSSGLGGSLPDEAKQAFAVLTPIAPRGVTSLAALRDQFQSIAWDIAHAGPGPGEGSWLDRTAVRLGEVVRVRPTGADVTGDSAAAVVARTEALLAGRSLREAVLEIRTLSDPSRNLAEGWLAAAEDRIAAEDAVSLLVGWATGRMILLDRKPAGAPKSTLKSG